MEIMDIPQRHNLDALLRDCLRRGLRSSFKSRLQICDELSIRLDRKISSNMLDNWTSESKQAWRLPADCIPVLCEILADDSLALTIVPSHLQKYITVGKWLMDSKWVLDYVKIQLPKRARAFARIRKVFDREIERRRRGK